ncbi:histidine kinase [Sulfurifustis variabilis]|uniref:histidine kinase n=1 Tax=Sulfurifustis variabilis TaxID=1675686 RepID=A0A1B4V4D7_9GAMM|nr:ATP-binding protein [Sulfurifustis variabilis]BAU48380.1 histidine kinase [Sulfurifustis variabilis]
MSIRGTPTSGVDSGSAIRAPRAVRALLPRRPADWLVAVALAAASVAVRPLVSGAFGDTITFIFAFPAVVVAGWYGGWRPAALTAGLCVAGNAVLVVLSGAPLLTGANATRVLIFSFSAVLIAVLAEQLRGARLALEKRVRLAEEQTDEMQRLSSEVERSKRELLLFLENNPALVWLKDADLRYVYVNESTSRSFGIPGEQWIGRTDRELFGPEIGARMHEIDERVLRENRVIREQKSSPANENLYYVVHRFPLPIAEGRIGIGATAVDVTREKTIEKRLREADQRKDAFIATLAHELRNPLAPLGNAARLLARRPEREVVEWAIGVIDRQVAQMARLLEDLLDVSRIKRNRLDLRRARVPLQDVLDAACEQSRPLLERAGQELQLELPADPVYLDGDKTRLAQVFANLLNNAARYARGPGKVAVVATEEGGDVVVSIKDHGIGIDPAALGSIFDDFFQLQPADRRGEGGLGLGLPLVKGLVELHGGSVKAYSEGVGKGSEFVVRLPAAGEPLVTRPPASTVPGSTAAERPLRVLVVDDNRDNADSMRALLEAFGHRPAVAYRADEALALGATFRPEAVLLDIGLPDMTGYECAELIRKTEWGRDVFLVAMTGWGKTEDKHRAFEAGFDEHLTKPVDLDRLEKGLARRTAPPAALRPGGLAHRHGDPRLN